MQAQKIISYTDEAGRLVDVPAFHPGQRVELIVLYSEESHPKRQKRRPPANLKGMIQERGDILSSVPTADWGIH